MSNTNHDGQGFAGVGAGQAASTTAVRGDNRVAIEQEHTHGDVRIREPGVDAALVAEGVEFGQGGPDPHAHGEGHVLDLLTAVSDVAVGVAQQEPHRGAAVGPCGVARRSAWGVAATGSSSCSRQR